MLSPRPFIALVLVGLLTPSSHAVPPLADNHGKRLAIETIKYKDDRLPFEVRYFRVGAQTPLLSSRISLEVLKSSMLLEGGSTSEKLSVTCTPGLMTTEVVSWNCHLYVYAMAGTAGENWSRTFAITGDDLQPIGIKDYFKPGAGVSIGKRLADKDYTNSLLDSKTDSVVWEHAYLAEGGVAFVAGGAEGHEERLTWKDLASYLAKKPPRDPPELPERWADDLPRPSFDEVLKGVQTDPTKLRFVADGGVVRDILTALEWAPVDNGADVTQGDAAAWVKAYRGGGHDDWRLPTLAELIMLRDLQDLRKDKGDCFGGRYAIALTPLIHMSCALAWASDGSAFGFVYGKLYSPGPKALKNYRALAVRGKSPVP